MRFAYVHHLLAHHFFLIQASLLLAQYGYLILLPVAVIEGPIAAILAGALVASGELNAYLVFLILVVGDLIGDFLYYSLGRWGHVHFIEKLTTRLGITESRIEPLKAEFRKNDWKFLLVGKTQGLGSIILYFAGVVRMDLFRFFAWNLVGTLPKAFLFECIGYLFGQSIMRSQRYVDYISLAFFAVALVLLALYIWAKRYLEREVTSRLSEQGEPSDATAKHSA